MSIPSIPRRHALPLIPGALIFLAACGQGDNGASSNGPKMVNVPGAVTAFPAGSSKITGHFEIRLAQPGEPFIFSNGTGGACVVAQYPVEPKSCTKHSECALPASGTGNGASSYCLAESPASPKAGNGGATPPNGAGTCWIKPSESFCLKFQSQGQHDTPPADTTAVAATGVKKWRVLSCLNGEPGACGGAKATPNELQHQAGPVYDAP